MSVLPRHSTELASSDVEVRRVILEEADRLLAGCDATPFSIRRLVAKCGHSAPTIYRHFGDKRQLLEDLLESRLERLASDLRAVPESHDAVDRLRAMAAVFVQFCDESPTYYRLFTIADGEDAVTPPSADVCSVLLAEPLDRLALEGRVETPDLSALKHAFWALVHGVVTLRAMRPDIDPDDRLLDVALDGMIAGTVSASASVLGASGRIS